MDWEYAPAPESSSIVDIRSSYGLFIDGEFLAPAGGRYVASVNPATEAPIAEVAWAGPSDVSRAVESARAAQPSWAALADRERGKYYTEQRLRTDLEQKVKTLDAFLRSLRMHVVISLVNPATIGRVAQLTQKTNQFNVTTRRYSEQELASLAADPAWRVFVLQASDRFGDNGIVGVAILHLHDCVAEIDTLLLSCRVIGRTVETALLATLAESATVAGAKRLVGWFRPTTKNAPAQQFYAAHRFTSTAVRDGATCWELDLSRDVVTPPAWITRQVVAEE